MIRISLHISTWLAVGAVLQSALVLLLPRFYALTPALFFLLYRFADTLLITFGFRRNPYMHDVFLGRTAAQVPNTDGDLADTPGKEGIVCLHLGTKSHHPLGLFAPGCRQLGEYMSGMINVLDKGGPESGCTLFHSHSPLHRSTF